jgi:hypothetical protein
MKVLITSLSMVKKLMSNTYGELVLLTQQDASHRMVLGITLVLDGALVL